MVDEDFGRFYAAFEERFRGSFELIKARLSVYVPEVSDCSDPRVLDLGCGRGEWLELLRENKIPAEGIDQNEHFSAPGISRGLKIKIGDIFESTASISSGQFTAITAFHVIEHLNWEAQIKLMREAFRLLKPDGVLIVEWPNPRNASVSASSFWLDPTHTRLLPSELVCFIAEYSGFKNVAVKTHRRYKPSGNLVPLVKHRTALQALCNRFLPRFLIPRSGVSIDDVHSALLGRDALGEDIAVIARKPGLNQHSEN